MVALFNNKRYKTIPERSPQRCDGCVFDDDLNCSDFKETIKMRCFNQIWTETKMMDKIFKKL